VLKGQHGLLERGGSKKEALDERERGPGVIYTQAFSPKELYPVQGRTGDW